MALAVRYLVSSSTYAKKTTTKFIIYNYVFFVHFFILKKPYLQNAVSLDEVER